MKLETVQSIIELDERIKTATSQFYNSAVAARVYDPVLGHVFGELELNATDILFVAILSDVHTLVTGPSGLGKTDLIKLVCQGVFGNEGWFLQKLNPHLNEEVFADIDMQQLGKSSLIQAIQPAPFLDYPCTILDEINRAPAALTNILLGFCDGQIQLKCGIKYDVGYRDEENHNRRYHLIFGTMNEGKMYSGCFELDNALVRRFTLTVPFGELPTTPYDRPEIIEHRVGHTKSTSFASAIGKIVSVNQAILGLPLDALSFTYLLYLGSVGSCPYSRNGYHLGNGNQEICLKKECRIVKIGNSFCPSVSRFSEGLLIFLKRATFGLTALRAARTVQAIRRACHDKDSDKAEKLRQFAEVNTKGDKLYMAVVKRYLGQVNVSVQDIKAMVPFVGMGGKVQLAPEYVAKHFAGSEWYALQNYAQETYIKMENFFREQQNLFQELTGGNGAIETLKQRLQHAERFSDPVIRHVIEPLLDRHQGKAKTPEQIAVELDNSKSIWKIAKNLVRS